MKARIVDRPPAPLPPEDPERVARMYRTLGSVRAVARELGRGRQLVRGLLDEHGVELRNEGTRDPSVRNLYVAWRSMVRRCDDPSHGSYANYGARSIGYIAGWRTFAAFRDWAMRSGWRNGSSLLLLDVNQDHSPENCRWGSRAEMLQLRTRVRSLAREPVPAFGEEKSAWAWARDPRCRVSYIGLLSRLRRGWPPQEAIALQPLAPAPRRRVRRREIQPMSGRLDWKRVLSMYEQGRSIEQIAALTGGSYSTIYSGLRARNALFRRSVTRKTPRDRALYGTWCRMRRACRGGNVGRRDRNTPSSTPDWNEFWAFREWALSQRYRIGQCLVRLDPNRRFEPGNCRFVPRSDVILYAHAPKQPLGRPRFRIRALGVAKGLAEWSRDPRCSVTAVTISRRLRSGWSARQAITDPPGKPGSAGQVLHAITAFGQTKGLVDWTRDRRCKVTATGLALRLKRGMDAETAITTPPYRLAAFQPRP